MFNVGDRVRIKPDINPYTNAGQVNVTGTIKHISSRCIEVLFDMPIRHKLTTIDAGYFGEYDLEPLTTGQSALYNLVSYSPLTWGIDLAAAVGGASQIPQKSLQAVCDVQGHQWRPYMGLNEHYDFCEAKGCEQKRPFTGKR